MRRILKRAAIFGGGALVVLLVAIQFLPYSRPVENPPTRVEPRWDSPRTRELAARACFDCHSNNVRHPWYAAVAPVSWLVRYDVEGARHKLNFSEWDLPQPGAFEAATQIEEGNMPLPIYVPLHPEAKLSAEEKAELIRGIRATVNGDRPRRR